MGSFFHLGFGSKDGPIFSYGGDTQTCSRTVPIGGKRDARQFLEVHSENVQLFTSTTRVAAINYGLGLRICPEYLELIIISYIFSTFPLQPSQSWKNLVPLFWKVKAATATLDQARVLHGNKVGGCESESWFRLVSSESTIDRWNPTILMRNPSTRTLRRGKLRIALGWQWTTRNFQCSLLAHQLQFCCLSTIFSHWKIGWQTMDSYFHERTNKIRKEPFRL